MSDNPGPGGWDADDHRPYGEDPYLRPAPDGGGAGPGAEAGYGAGLPGAAEASIGRGVRQPGGEEPPQAPVAVAAPGLRVGAAVRAGFRGVNANLGVWLGGAALAGLAVFAVNATVSMLGMPAPGVDPNPETLPEAIDQLVTPAAFAGQVITGMAGMLLQVLGLRGAFEYLDGRRLRFGDFFRVDTWGAAILTWLLVTALGVVATLIAMPLGVKGVADRDLVLSLTGLVLLLVLSLAVGLCTMFAQHFVLDDRRGPVEAIRANITAITPVLLPLIGLIIVNGLLVLLGAMLCLVGMLYFVPVTVVASAHAYRQIVGGRRPVAA